MSGHAPSWGRLEDVLEGKVCCWSSSVLSTTNSRMESGDLPCKVHERCAREIYHLRPFCWVWWFYSVTSKHWRSCIAILLLKAACNGHDQWHLRAGGYGSIAKTGKTKLQGRRVQKEVTLALLVPSRFYLCFIFLLRKQLCSCNRSKWKARGLGRLRKQPVFKIISCKFLPFLGRFAGLDKANLKKKWALASFS